jgi:serine protease AprX
MHQHLQPRAIRTIAAALVALISFAVYDGPAHAATEKIDVLVRVTDGAEGDVSAAVRSLGGDPGKPLDILSGFRAKVPADRLDALREVTGVESVVMNVDIPFDAAFYEHDKVSSSLYHIAKNIGVDELWKDGYTGAGIDVAVIDSGVADLPEFGDRLVRGPNLSFDADASQHADGFGHGTNMAGIIAGRDPALSLDPAELRDGAKRHFVGVAPGARIVDMKVAAADGAVDVSQVIAAIDWVVQHRNTDGRNIRVLNLSFGTDGTQDYQLDPLTFAVENAWRHGIVVVVSAGNDGYGSPQLNNPAYDPFVIAVAASDTNRTSGSADDFIADFSSRGDLSRRPDVAAPGRSVVSLRAPGSYIDTTFAGARVGKRLFRGSGTSQAAAVTSGAVAVLLQRYPHLTPDQVKAAFTATGLKLKTRKGEVLEKGMKGLDVDKAADKVKDVLEGKLPSSQMFSPATGLGSIEAARGSEHVTDGETTLTGEIDVTGAAWDARSWRDDAWNARSWRGSSWRARSWRSDGWTARSWRSDVWQGRSWRGSGWLAAEFVPVDTL